MYRRLLPWGPAQLGWAHILYLCIVSLCSTPCGGAGYLLYNALYWVALQRSWKGLAIRIGILVTLGPGRRGPQLLPLMGGTLNIPLPVLGACIGTVYKSLPVGVQGLGAGGTKWCHWQRRLPPSCLGDAVYLCLGRRGCSMDTCTCRRLATLHHVALQWEVAYRRTFRYGMKTT